MAPKAPREQVLIPMKIFFDAEILFQADPVVTHFELEVFFPVEDSLSCARTQHRSLLFAFEEMHT